MTRSLGLVDKLKLLGSSGFGNGVYVDGAGSATLGKDLVIGKFLNGVRTEGGFVRAEGVTCDGNDEVGFEARTGGVIWAINARASNNGTDGFSAFMGSTIFADGATATDNQLYGFHANLASSIQASNAASSGGGQHGFDANANSTIFVADASATGGTFGYAAWNDSYLEAVTSSANTTGTGFSSRFGSFVHLTTPSGSSATFNLTPNTFGTVERNMIEQE